MHCPKVDAQTMECSCWRMQRVCLIVQNAVSKIWRSELRHSALFQTDTSPLIQRYSWQNQKLAILKISNGDNLNIADCTYSSLKKLKIKNKSIVNFRPYLIHVSIWYTLYWKHKNLYTNTHLYIRLISGLCECGLYIVKWLATSDWIGLYKLIVITTALYHSQHVTDKLGWINESSCLDADLDFSLPCCNFRFKHFTSWAGINSGNGHHVWSVWCEDGDWALHRFTSCQLVWVDSCFVIPVCS